mmetsp:Transcript_1983/g.4383  ORF Transcript_1983/g.4383 Transcript_1983/m.4383 type:complete len:213 (-) Transcript_1983:704-1342(-)
MMTSAMKVMSLLCVACRIFTSRAFGKSFDGPVGRAFPSPFGASFSRSEQEALASPAADSGQASARCFSLTTSRLPDSNCTVACPSSTFLGSEGRIVTACPLYSGLCMLRRNIFWPMLNFPDLTVVGGKVASLCRPTNSSGGMESSEPASSLSLWTHLKGGISSESLSSINFSILSWRTASTRADLTNFTATLPFFTASMSGTMCALWPLYSA